MGGTRRDREGRDVTELGRQVLYVLILAGLLVSLVLGIFGGGG